MRCLRLIAVLAVLVPLLAAGSALAVINGAPDGNAHPYVGLAHDGTTVCSGSLVSPTVYVTAAHCFGGVPSEFGTSPDGLPIVQLTFDPNGLKATDPRTFLGVVHNDPTFCTGCGKGAVGFSYHDLAVVVLEEPVPTGVVGRYAQLPALDQSGHLDKHGDVDVVGYGIQGWTKGKNPQPTAAGTRAWITTQLQNQNRTATALLLKSNSSGTGSGGPCFGDSGGPYLVAGTNTMIGVDSFVRDSVCKQAAYATRIDTADELAFIDGFLH